ncbi:mannose-P-dolichol utilization defect 1 protein homolog [Penaeus indicus]|uniref:mannose-P-dolichol utilization defect 1 protein homolog n=1 Tax=Penaeus indicus TaxID=29960 RepID=UPI00300C1D88
MAELFRNLTLLLMTEKCFDKFFVENEFLDGPCLAALISTCLGYGITLGAMMVKLPQIIKIIVAKSGEGISVVGTSLELLAAMITTSYNFLKAHAFSSYGDSYFITLQNSIIGFLVYYYSSSALPAILYLTAALSTTALLCYGMVPLNILWYLQAMNIPMVFAGKMVQAVSNYKNGSTGQLSVVTVCLLFFGSASRIFTSIQDTGDQVMIIQYCVATLANFILLAQIYIYWDVPAAKKGGRKKDRSASNKKKQ